MIAKGALVSLEDQRWKEYLDADWNTGLVMLKPRTEGVKVPTRLAELDRDTRILKLCDSFPAEFLPDFDRSAWILEANA